MIEIIMCRNTSATVGKKAFKKVEQTHNAMLNTVTVSHSFKWSSC